MPLGFEIKQYKFERPFYETGDSSKTISSHVMGVNWPVVYILHGNQEVYVGETSSVVRRMEQHSDPLGKYYEKRKKIDTVEIIFDSTFNKSAVLDIEQSLINLFRFEIEQTRDNSKKSKYFRKLQNGNGGQSKQHNYYQRARYQEEIKEIWDELQRRNLATNKYQDIINDTLFKYSPYTALNEEQKVVCIKVLNNVLDALEQNKPYTAIINGVAGTGKTIVLLHMLTRFVEAFYSNQTDFEAEDITDEEEYEFNEETKLRNRIKKMFPDHCPKIAYVAQMTSLQGTIGSVLSNIPHLHKSTSKTPSHMVNGYYGDGEKPFDIVFVDEAHRLCQYNSISWRGAFKETCKKLFGQDADPFDYTTLDWILKCSKTQVMIYDEFQTVKDSDITPAQFHKSISFRPIDSIDRHVLTKQMRCVAGEEYIEYLTRIFNGDRNIKKKEFEGYELKLYDNPNKLIEDIIEKNRIFGLSKVTAGYGWQWNTKSYENCRKKYLKYLDKNNLKDRRSRQVDYYCENLNEEDGLIVLNGQKYVRNLDYNWLLEGDAREIGCIHTSQGYDLNYVGVLFSPEMIYRDDKVAVEYNAIRDGGVNHTFNGLSEQDVEAKKERVKNYVINSYKVMMERGIKGCYIYATDKELREYLSQFMEVVESGDNQVDIVENADTNIFSFAAEPIQSADSIEIWDDEDIPEIDKYIKYIPLYTIKAACGRFLEQDYEASIKGWVDVSKYGIHKKGREYFIVQASGNSMVPKIHDKEYCLFRHGGSIYRGDVAIAGIHDLDSSYNGRYTIKDYYQEFEEIDGVRERVLVTLKPRNRNGEYPEFILTEDDSDGFGIFGVLEEVIKPR